MKYVALILLVSQSLCAAVAPFNFQPNFQANETTFVGWLKLDPTIADAPISIGATDVVVSKIPPENMFTLSIGYQQFTCFLKTKKLRGCPDFNRATVAHKPGSVDVRICIPLKSSQSPKQRRTKAQD